MTPLIHYVKWMGSSFFCPCKLQLQVSYYFSINFILEIITPFTYIIILAKYFIHFFFFKHHSVSRHWWSYSRTTIIWSVLHKYDREDSVCQLRSLHQIWNITSGHTVYDCEPKLNQPPSWPHAAPPSSSEWSGWTFLVCAVNRNCAFIIHIMNHARKQAAQCWGWSLCVCVRACVCEGKSGGYDEAPRQKGRYYATIQLEAFFFKCPSVAFVTSSFHVTTGHLLLKFLNIFWNLPASCFIFSASLPFAGPIHSVPQVKGNQRNIAPPTLFHRLSPLSYTPQVHVLLFCIWN